jgi:pyruvate/2-oxoglutarate dehydrogenase complex dihydrolipoamide acyltransferase (E2) component
MNLIGKYIEKPFPEIREIIVDTVEEGLRRHHVKGLIELDVTNGRDHIRKHKEATGESLSFTAWIKCIAQAVSENRAVQGLRKGNKIIIFDDVDITVSVERVIGDQNFPINLTIRKANEKSFKEIHSEIRAAQTQTIEDYLKNNEQLQRAQALLLSPKSRSYKLFWQKLRTDPFFVKEYLGTVGITSVGMFGKITGWPITTSLHGLFFALGGITKKPGVVDDKIEIREYLNMTVMFDHDVVDGAPAARFIARLTELVENGLELAEK